MKDTYQFSSYPVGHRQHGHRIHVVGIDISAGVPHSAVITNFIERRQQSWYQNLKATWNVDVGLKPTARRHKISGFGRTRTVGSFRMTVENRIDNFTELAATELG